MPVGIYKIYPFLATVCACRTVKEVIGARVDLVKKCDEAVLRGGLLIHIKAELPVHGFELVTCFIHVSILLQFCLSVKSIASDFLGIRLVRLRGTEGIVLEAPD